MGKRTQGEAQVQVLELMLFTGVLWVALSPDVKAQFLPGESLKVVVSAVGAVALLLRWLGRGIWLWWRWRVWRLVPVCLRRPVRRWSRRRRRMPRAVGWGVPSWMRVRERR